MDIVNDLTDDHVAYWRSQFPKAARTTMHAPTSLDDCVPCAAIWTEDERRIPIVRVAWRPDAADLAALAAGGTIWLSTWGGLPPHMLEVQA